jgi:hypothetical protein
MKSLVVSLSIIVAVIVVSPALIRILIGDACSVNVSVISSDLARLVQLSWPYAVWLSITNGSSKTRKHAVGFCLTGYQDQFRNAAAP